MANTNVRDVRFEIADFLEKAFLFSFKENAVSDEDNLFEAGYIDSFGLIQLVLFLEKEFSIAVPQNMMSSPKLASLSGMVAFVEERLSVG